jgi:hypothetical protein
MTPFQIIFHYINNKREIEALEKSFLDINEQIDLYEKQFLNTINSYLKSRQQELEELEKRYVKIEENAQKRYDEALGTENTDDQNNIAYATHISGIDHFFLRKAEEIEKINVKYSDFLDLFSKSTLVALYSLNENFLNKICDIASQTFNQKIKVSHFNSRDYLKASFNYLELVIDISREPFKSYESKLEEIQKVRNKIIHAGSKISGESILKFVKTYSHSFNYNKENKFLIVTSPKFTTYFINLIKSLYEEILWSLEEKQNYETLKHILENWYGLIEGKIIISEISSKKTSEKKRTIDFKAESDNGNIPEFYGKLTLTSSKGYVVEIIDQTGNELIKEFLEADKDGINLEKDLKAFMTFNKNLDISLLIY